MPETRALIDVDVDVLAHVVATALERGHDRHAWHLTLALERAAGIVDDSQRPANPVIGRRFARAHAQLQAQTPPTAARARDHGRG